jgi:G:T-mismatch repair DNA endonuclease (very short patch repair protein)
MRVIGLDGKEYKFNPKTKIRANASKLHIKCRELLQEIMPRYKILEEVLLSGCNGKLYADFYIPSIQSVIEVHGQQHTVYNDHFYKSKSQFLKAKVRDNNKKEWCFLNEIELIELNYNEGIDEWADKIRH